MQKHSPQKNIQLYLIISLALLLCTGILLSEKENLRHWILKMLGKEHRSNSMTVYNIGLGMSMFRIDCKRFPSAEEGFRPLFEDTGIEGWHGPYLGKKLEDLLDEWGQPFYYEYIESERKARIGSCGPDRVKDTSDDIVSETYG